MFVDGRVEVGSELVSSGPEFLIELLKELPIISHSHFPKMHPKRKSGRRLDAAVRAADPKPEAPILAVFFGAVRF